VSAVGIAVRCAGPSRTQLLGELLAWLNTRFAPDGPPILADTPLFVGGLVDSLRVLELIAWTERAIGREIPDAAIRTDNFATAARIAELFARGGSDARR
jgi:acyl carrier protein